MSEEGIFSGVAGLSYRCDSIEGTTTADCKFHYRPGMPLVFSIGDLVIGTSVGKPLLTVSDFVSSNSPEFDPKLLNRARLLYSLTASQGFETPIVIDAKVRAAINRFVPQINLDSASPTNLDKALSGICDELKLVPKSISHTRNHLRREAAGFRVLRDIQIPTSDGNEVLADVYLPLQHDLGTTYPVLVSCTIYGRRVFHSGPDLTIKNEIEAFEEAEDDWHSTSSDIAIKVPRGSWGSAWETQRGFENIATFNTFTYVPHGYAMVKVDPRGVSQTPGVRGVPGQLTSDFYDAVEWAAAQNWSNGNVAMVGSSYGANTQWDVASLKPKGLKCFVPYATDLDMYREAAYTGGIPTHRYLVDWFTRVQKSSPRWPNHIDLLGMMSMHPFYDSIWEMISTKSVSSDVPCFLAAPQIFIIHGRGAYEAWRMRSSKNTHLQLVDCNYYPWPSQHASGKILQFLNYHLKGVEHPQLEKVGIQMRLGHREWYWRKEANWPVPGTEYIKWHLHTDGTLAREATNQPEKRFEYASKLPPTDTKSGVSFCSAPFEQDVEFAGHFTALLNVSSTTPDADFVVTLWAVDRAGNIVPYGSAGQPEPLAKGFLRASHRKTDQSKTLPERPWHTHTEKDNSLMGPGEVVQVEVEIFPAAGRICEGWKLRVDVSPSEDQPDIPGYKPQGMRIWYGEEHEGTNSIHVGAGRLNYVSCPMVPVKQGFPNIMHA